MAVYVDNAYIPATVRSGSRHHTSRWCHLFADSDNELVLFATRFLDLKEKYLQTESVLIHFDLTLSKRSQAIQYGAIPVDMMWVKNRIREVRKNGKS